LILSISTRRAVLGFIGRSAADFDQGHREEAIRIATALRVIFHQTGRSTSLLQDLNGTTVKFEATLRIGKRRRGPGREHNCRGVFMIAGVNLSSRREMRAVHGCNGASPNDQRAGVVARGIRACRPRPSQGVTTLFCGLRFFLIEPGLKARMED
jgi:hypothetical protein